MAYLTPEGEVTDNKGGSVRHEPRTNINRSPVLPGGDHRRGESGRGTARAYPGVADGERGAGCR